MAFTKKPVMPVDDEAAEGEMPPKKKGKGKMPAPGVGKPNWQKIAAQMMKK